MSSDNHNDTKKLFKEKFGDCIGNMWEINGIEAGPNYKNTDQFSISNYSIYIIFSISSPFL